MSPRIHWRLCLLQGLLYGVTLVVFSRPRPSAWRSISVSSAT